LAGKPGSQSVIAYPTKPLSLDPVGPKVCLEVLKVIAKLEDTVMQSRGILDDFFCAY
jgi:hypothetical protein